MNNIDENDNIDKSIGIWIKIHRVQQNYTQKGLADQLELSAQQIQKYEQGLSKITVSLLKRLAIILDTSLENFLQPIEKTEQTLVSRRPARTKKTLESRQNIKNVPRISDIDMENTLIDAIRNIESYDVKMSIISMVTTIAESPAKAK